MGQSACREEVRRMPSQAQRGQFAELYSRATADVAELIKIGKQQQAITLAEAIAQLIPRTVGPGVEWPVVLTYMQHYYQQHPEANRQKEFQDYMQWIERIRRMPEDPDAAP